MFKIDFTKPFIYKDIIYFNQGNLSVNNTLRCKLDLGNDNDLTGATISTTFKVASKEIVEQANVIDGVNAIVDIVFPSNALVAGVNTLEVISTKGGRASQSPTIKYEVWQGITSGNGVQGDSNYPILINLINNANDAIVKANNANALATDNYRKLDSALSSANSAISSTNIAKNEAIKATDNAIVATDNANKKIEDVEARFNRLSTSQQQDAEVIDARDGEISLNARLERDLAKGKIHFETVEGSHISTDSVEGYLKNVEIKGNTIQDANNLADIKSVGDKVEGQELYEIPLLCTGKNAHSSNIKRGNLNANTGIEENGARTILCTDDFEIAKPLTKYVISSNLSIASVLLMSYDANKNYIGFSNLTSGYHETKANTKYVKFRLGKTGSDEFTDAEVESIKIQREEGTVATTYEAYKEDKLTILSPCQLDKIYDVVDMIVEKDDVWGVSNNIDTKVLKSDDITNTPRSWGTEGLYRTHVAYTDLGLGGYSYLKLLSNLKTLNGVEYTNGNTIGIYGHNTDLMFVLPSSCDTLQKAKEYLTGFVFKYQINSTQFIPLPHSQQIKLRTFANRTNISFLCDVEGTIKADVPKSLGATVNTHTTQIDSLNRELERVKRLEESTVSTVVTESDFTVVEQTNQGYFEDVELKGKTLVNVQGSKRNINNSTISNFLHIHNTKTNLSINTVYTYVIIDKNNKFLNCKVCSDNNTNVWKDVNYNRIGTFITPDKFPLDLSVSIFAYPKPNLSVDIDDFDFIILEGDHTQNPPSYFEGLKSVGDGTDEIVVSSSDNGNLINYNILTLSKVLRISDGVLTDNASFDVTDFIEVGYGNYYLKSPYVNSVTYGWCYYDSNKNLIGGKASNPSNISANGGIITIPCNCRYVRLTIKNDNEAIFNRGTETTNDKEYRKADKKRLLFLDEDGTWKKPILDEFSEVKKGSDGVYRYYKRGLTRAYKAGDETNPNCITDMTNTVEKVNEQVYECTNIDLITYPNETNYHIKSGVLSPRTTLKVHSNISNIVSLLQKKVSLLESNMSKYMITQNRLMLDSRYIADSTTFKVDISTVSDRGYDVDSDIYDLLLKNIIVGVDNYDRIKMENMINDYFMWFIIDMDMYMELLNLIEFQHNPPKNDEVVE